MRAIEAGSEVLIVEGVGGAMVPLDASHTVLDLVRWLMLPVVVVARPDLGTINHTLLTLAALRSVGATITGVVINRYPTDTPDAAQETNPRVIEKWGKVPLLCVTPNEPVSSFHVPAGIAAAIETVDWERFSPH
jgi:dethiobiotin synthetase